MKFAPALVLLACLTSANHAFAHAHLEAQMPGADAVLSVSPTAVSLRFSEELEINFSGVILKGQDGATIRTGAPALASTDHKQMSVPLTGPLGAGKYSVEWHALSKDGHTTHGSYQFTIRP